MKKKYIFVFIFVFLISVIPSFVYSQQSTNLQTNNQGLFQFDRPDQEIKLPGFFGMVVKTLVILGVFGFGIYYIFRYISKKQGIAFPSLNIIKIIASVPVGTNRFIQIVEVGNKYYLIGSTDNNIRLLSEIIDKETLDMIKVLKNKENKSGPPSSFTGFLNNLLGGISKKITAKDNIKFLKIQKDRIKNLKL